MKSPTPILALILLLAIALSCKLAENLAGGPKAGTVSDLWSDVPPLPGASKADLEIPLGARLLIRTVMKGRVNFIAFTTDQSAKDVQAYYSNDRMQAAGWTPSETGCVGDTEDKEKQGADTEDKGNQGAVCFFKRKTGALEEGLAIILAQDEKTRQTSIFYARIDLTDVTPTPTR